MKTDSERLAAWVKRACSHVRRPKNLQEIVDDLESNEYNAEQTVQHMAMLLCTQTTTTETQSNGNKTVQTDS